MAKWQEIETKQTIKLLQQVEDNHKDQEAKETNHTIQETKGNSHVETNVDGATMGMRKLGLMKTMLVPHHRSKDKDRKSTRLNSSHITRSRMPSSA